MKSEDIKRDRRTQYNFNPSPDYIEAVQTLEELDDLEDVYAEVMSVKRNPGGKFPNGAQLDKLLHKHRVQIPGREEEVDSDTWAIFSAYSTTRLRISIPTASIS